jgi:hypothetical protein
MQHNALAARARRGLVNMQVACNRAPVQDLLPRPELAVLLRTLTDALGIFLPILWVVGVFHRQSRLAPRRTSKGNSPVEEKCHMDLKKASLGGGLAAVAGS